jgi:hypothetical protein
MTITVRPTVDFTRGAPQPGVEIWIDGVRFFTPATSDAQARQMALDVARKLIENRGVVAELEYPRAEGDA